jgi:hypothetical protein
VSVNFQTATTQLEASILTLPPFPNFQQSRFLNLTFIPGSVTSHQEFSTYHSPFALKELIHA